MVYVHSGGLPGFTCYIMRIPDTRRTIIILGNFDRLGRTLQDVAAILRGDSVPVPRARHIIATDSAAQAALAGVYRTAARDSVVVRLEDGSFVATQPGKFRVQLLPESAQDYFAAQLRGSARFRANGRRTTLVIEDGLGREVVRAERPRR